MSGEMLVKGAIAAPPALARDAEFVQRVREASARLTGVEGRLNGDKRPCMFGACGALGGL